MIRQRTSFAWTLLIVLSGSSLCSAAVIDTFTGGDAGEGLKLTGPFVYAVNVDGAGTSGTAADFTVNGAVFKDDYPTLIPGVAPFYTSAGNPWATSPNYGGSSNDSNLASINHNIAIPLNNRLSHELTVVPGQNYQLQAIFNENFFGAGSGRDTQTREQDVLLYDGAYIDNLGTGRTIFDEVDNLNVVDIVGALNTLGTGVVVTMNFTALTDTVTLVNRSPVSPTDGLDTTPILNAFTLQVVPEPASIALWLLWGLAMMGYGWFRTGQLRS